MRRERWLAAGTSAAFVLSLGLTIPAGFAERIAPGTRASHDCGGHERWRVKTLTDARADEVNFTPKRTTIDALRAKPVPVPIRASTPRLDGVETTTYRVRATLVDARLVEDEDFHLVIRDRHRAHTMIVEFPDVRCQPAARSIKKEAMRRAREALIRACGTIPTSFVHLKGTATITGVGFFDKKHGQRGLAPNGIELHPVLSFRDASCERQ